MTRPGTPIRIADGLTLRLVKVPPNCTDDELEAAAMDAAALRLLWERYWRQEVARVAAS